MHYVKSIPKADSEQRDLLQKSGWKKLKEPESVFCAILCSLPISIILGGIIIGFAFWLKPDLFSIFGNDKIVFVIQPKFILVVILYFVYMFIHEMIHAVCIPNVFKSKKTVWGINGCFAFVATEEKMSKHRFILISVMPFFVLSFIAITLCYILNVLNWYVLFFALLNAMGSCVDVFNVLLVLLQVRNGQNIITIGTETYFK